MGRKKPNFYQQSGVIPYRAIDGKIEVLLITSIKCRSWVIPKGGICQGMSAADFAAKEAWEEAGVIGQVYTQKIGTFKYCKHGKQYRVTLFLLLVEMLCENWTESLHRERQWLDINQPIRLVKEVSLKRVMRSLKNKVKI
jgi:8-oxo-dGTP pyrophosphatase MutT (NUDIX family)